jgi:hypothetical protein
LVCLIGFRKMDATSQKQRSRTAVRGYPENKDGQRLALVRMVDGMTARMKGRTNVSARTAERIKGRFAKFLRFVQGDMGKG